MAEPPNFTTTSMPLRDRHNFRRRSVSMVGISVRRRSSEVRVANRMARRQQRFGCRVRLKHAQKGNWVGESANIESKIGILVKFVGLNMNRTRKMNPIRGDSRESNSGPLAPEARIIPLDHYPDLTSVAPPPNYIGSASTGRARLRFGRATI